MKFKGSKTEKNLYKIFTNKSRNYTRYILFSEKARIEGHRWVQKEFEILANNELAHAREIYGAYLNLLGRTLENIGECVSIESLEKKNFYEVFEKEAKEEGFNDIIPYFNGLSQISDNHINRLKMLNNSLMNENSINKSKSRRSECMNCGYIYEKNSSNIVCPVCKYSRSHCRPYD